MIKEIVKKIIPKSVMKKRRLRIAIKDQLKYADKSVAETFSEIYKNNVWGGKPGEFFSGEGSCGKYAEVYSEAVEKFIRENNVKSVVDLGCGDFQIASMFVYDDFHYTGCDIVPDLIEHLEKNFGSEKISFRQVNIIEDELPDGELCLIRQVLQHLSNSEIGRILENCKKFKYLIITEHYPAPNDELVPNIDIPHGPDMRLHYDSAVVLDKPPFNETGVKLLVEIEAEDDTRIKTFLINR